MGLSKTWTGLDQFLNQARASQRLACTWFLEITFVHEVGVCVCVSTLKVINYIHVILNLYNQLNKFVAFKNEAFYAWPRPL